ncbi:glycosyltransferase [Paeniglutamicibacter sp. R2-26]|uniref:glycosyltransferase n=1 Tax=Paeniglutamicibacter sp. R2-26 TaxID=3144417 RepID=UPI003EE50B3B
MAQVFDPGTAAASPSRPDHPREGARQALMVTWSVSDTFGGMTAMCLKRASLFHERGVPSAVVTFKPEPAFDSIRASLVAHRKLHPGVPILNLHEYYASVPAETSPARPDPREHEQFEWNHHSSTRRDIDGSLLFTEHSSRIHAGISYREHYRPDGTIYLTDSVLPSEQDARKTRRILRLLDPQGQVRAEFAGASELYKHWLGKLVGRAETDILVDSKFSAGFLWSFEHPLAMKFVNFHSTHISPGEDPLTGKLSDAHQGIIANRENWDGITFLTRSQREAFVARFGDQGNTVVISNAVDGPAELPDFARRERSLVVHVGRFTKGKNLPEVVDIVHDVAAGGTPVRLDLIGEGEQHRDLEEHVRKRGMEAIVRFRGHLDNVEEELSASKVLLLCSKFEGQSLALLEAQAAGCVPVAYDVDFGPRDVIRHGVTGILVPFQDRRAAVRAVERLLRDDDWCEELSRNAFDLAKHYTSDEIFGQWMQALDAARAKQSARRSMAGAKARLSALRFHADGTLEIEIGTELAGLGLDGLELVLSERGNPDAPAVKCPPIRETEDGFGFLVPADLRTRISGSGAIDVHVRFETDGVGRTVRLGADPKPGSSPFLTAYGNLSFK